MLFWCIFWPRFIFCRYEFSKTFFLKDAWRCNCDAMHFCMLIKNQSKKRRKVKPQNTNLYKNLPLYVDTSVPKPKSNSFTTTQNVMKGVKNQAAFKDPRVHV